MAADINKFSMDGVVLSIFGVWVLEVGLGIFLSGLNDPDIKMSGNGWDISRCLELFFCHCCG